MLVTASKYLALSAGEQSDVTKLAANYPTFRQTDIFE
jgi:hypothetical protein